MSMVQKCPFCGQDANGKYEPFKLPDARGSFSRICQCSSCRLLFRQVDGQQDLSELYKVAWSDVDHHKQETGGTDAKLARVYAAKLAGSLGFKDFSGLKILEFGAGDGSMLEALSELGADVYGCEPFGYEEIKRKGFKAFRSLEEIPQGTQFDGVVSIDVLEHVPAPWSTLQDLFALTASKGWLCVTTPNANSLNARLSGPKWREMHNPGHLFFLTSRSLEAIFRHLGFTKTKKLKWFVQYSNNILKRSMHSLLQLSGLDGELRYLINKS